MNTKSIANIFVVSSRLHDSSEDTEDSLLSPQLTRVGRANIERAEDGPSSWSSNYRGDSRAEEEAELRANVSRYYRGDRRDQPPFSSVVYPDCWNEDQDALDELLAAIRGRRQNRLRA
jgi:hypothetical protein